MMNNKRIFSSIMAAIFMTYVLLVGVPASASTKKILEKYQISNATKYVIAAENYAKPKTFTVKWAQISVYSAEAQINKIASKTVRNILTNRLTKVQLKINARAKNISDTNKAMVKVILLEKAARLNLTIGVNLTTAEALITPTITEVAKLMDGTAKVALQGRILVAKTKITKARTAFNAALLATHNVTTLSAVILTAQGLYDGATEGTANGNYVVGSKGILQSAIAAAQTVVTNAGVTTQADIDTATAVLNAAVAAFNAGQVATHDVTTLSAIILTAQGLYDGTTEGTANVNYAVGSKGILQSAIAAAQTVVTNAGVTTQADIDTAATVLDAAITVFNAGQVATHDVTTLSALILTAQGLYDGATEGTANGNYAVGSKAILQSAIAAAQTITTNAAVTTQADIDTEVAVLNAAVAAFNAGQVVTHDVTALSAAIVTAQGVYDGATEGTENGNYAVGSKAILQAAIAASQTVVTNAGVTTQADIDTEAAVLNAAIATFNAGQVII
jgi:hypothetical protein